VRCGTKVNRDPRMPDDPLSDDEKKLLINLLTVEIEASKFPLSPRIESLKRIRAKLRGESVQPTVAPQQNPKSRK
jgi:hypothetical protein